MSTRQLNTRQENFKREYMKDHNATQAAIRAGYSAKTAGQQGYLLLKKLEISTEISEKALKRLENLDISVERILKERARLAFFDVRKLLDNTGRPLAISELDDDTAAAIQGLDVQDVYSKGEDGERNLSTIVKYKLADKDKSLTALEHYQGMRKDKSTPEAMLNIVINLA